MARIQWEKDFEQAKSLLTEAAFTGAMTLAKKETSTFGDFRESIGAFALQALVFCITVGGRDEVPEKIKRQAASVIKQVNGFAGPVLAHPALASYLESVNSDAVDDEQHAPLMDDLISVRSLAIFIPREDKLVPGCRLEIARIEEYGGNIMLTVDIADLTALTAALTKAISNTLEAAAAVAKGGLLDREIVGGLADPIERMGVILQTLREQVSEYSEQKSIAPSTARRPAKT